MQKKQKTKKVEILTREMKQRRPKAKSEKRRKENANRMLRKKEKSEGKEGKDQSVAWMRVNTLNIHAGKWSS